jgi:hypothetical protein
MQIALKGATELIPDNLECGGAASSSAFGAPHNSSSLTISDPLRNRSFKKIKKHISEF